MNKRNRRRHFSLTLREDYPYSHRAKGKRALMLRGDWINETDPMPKLRNLDGRYYVHRRK